MNEQVPGTLPTDSVSQIALGDRVVATSIGTSLSSVVAPYPLEQSINIGEHLSANSPNIFQVLADLELEATRDRLDDLSTSISPFNEFLFEFDTKALANQHHESESAYIEQQSSSERKEALESEIEPAFEPEQTCCHDGYPRHDHSRGKKLTSERSRRKRINGKLKELQELIPHSYKKDQASILDDAVKHIQSLKLQRDILTNGFRSHSTNMSMMMRPGFGQFQMGPPSPSGYTLMFPVPQLPQAQVQVVGAPVLRPPVSVSSTVQVPPPLVAVHRQPEPTGSTSYQASPSQLTWSSSR